MNGSSVSRLAGICLLGLAMTMIVVAITFGAATGESDMSRAEIEEFLADAEDNEGLFAIAIGAQTAGAMFILAVASALHLLLSERNRFAASFARAALLSAVAATIVNAGANFTLATLANDLADGGAGGAGRSEVLEIARAVGALDTFAWLASIALTGIGVAAFGVVLLGRPSEAQALTPPRWLGWLALAGGALSAAALLVLLDEAFFGLSSLGQLLVLVWSLLLGGWLVMKAGHEPQKQAAFEPAAG